MNLIKEIIGELPNALVLNEFAVSYDEYCPFENINLSISANLPRVPDDYVFPRSITMAHTAYGNFVDDVLWQISESPVILAMHLQIDRLFIKNYESHTNQTLLLADPESVTRLRSELLELAEKNFLLVCVNKEVVFLSLA